MSATLISSNVTIKVSAAVDATATANANTQTIYTAPANGYAIVQFAVTTNAGSAGSVSVGSRAMMTFASGNTFPTMTASTASMSLPIAYLGPSQEIKITANTGANVTCVVTGVAFINSP